MLKQQKQLIIFAEGQSDAEFMMTVFPDSQKKHIKVIASTGYSSMVSMAKSILITYDAYVLLVLDADTTHKAVIEEKRKDMLFSFASLGKRDFVQIFFFVPNLEYVFFEKKALRDKLFNSKETSELTFGKSPSQVVREKYHSTLELIKRLSEEQVELLRASPQVNSLIDTAAEYLKMVNK
jgi:predicted ATP-dependent endonuclease of OLD family